MWNHILPLNDLIEHENGIDLYCPCNPTIDVENQIVIHDSLDGREAIEWANEQREHFISKHKEG